MVETPDLSGQTAFITGTSRGIGKRIALGLAESGCNVVSTGRTVEGDGDSSGTIRETAAECAEYGVESHAIRMDLRDSESIRSAVEEAIEEMGEVNIVINNASALTMGNIEYVPTEQFDRMNDVNARGTYIVSRTFVDHLKDATNDAWILTNGPPVTVDRSPGMAPYALSKMGMSFVTLSLAGELSGYDIGCNTFWPVTAIDTPSTRDSAISTRDDRRTPDIVSDAILEVLKRDPAEFTGETVYDEEILREAGVEDFAPYNLTPGDPEPLSVQTFDPAYTRTDR